MGTFIRVVEFDEASRKEKAFFDDANKYIINENIFKYVPGMSYAYWIKSDYLNVYPKSENIRNYIDTFQGIISGSNDTMLHLWFEMDVNKIPIDATSMEEVDLSKQYWIPYNKGGKFRKWYGIQDYVIFWKNGPDDKTRGKKGFSKYYLQPYVAWSYTVSNSIATRYYPPGFLWDVRGSGIFGEYEDILYLQAMISSKVGYAFFKIDSSVMSCQVENIENLPVIMNNSKKQEILSITRENIMISKKEWDSYELSWKYEKHPLSDLKWDSKAILIETKYKEYESSCLNAHEKIKKNEELLNKEFIDIYGLSTVLSPEVSDEDITIAKANIEKEIKSLISYAVGCILGRYSLKEEGLIFAGGKWDETKYTDDFKPCEYGIIPITENQYFEEDLCTRVIDFIKVVYGEDTLNDNLKFIANALKPDSYEAPKKIIRDYLFNGFFDNHYQIYQHRPIYWQLDSGKAGGFRAIMYMHRFNENTLSTVRTEYIQELRYKYEDELQRLQHKLGDANTTAEKNDVKKQATAIDKKLVECTVYDDLLNHVTGSIQNYVFDLDDGVKTNYAKFLSINGDKTKNVLTVIKL